MIFININYIQKHIFIKFLLIIFFVVVLLLFGGFVLIKSNIETNDEIPEITDLYTYNGKPVVYGKWTYRNSLIPLGLPIRDNGHKYYSSMKPYFDEQKEKDVYYGIGVQIDYLEDDLGKRFKPYNDRICEKLEKIESIRDEIKFGLKGQEGWDEIAEQKEKLNICFEERREFAIDIYKIKIKNQIQYFRDQGIPAIEFDDGQGDDLITNLLIFVKSYNQLEDFQPHPEYAYVFFEVGEHDNNTLQ